MGRARPQIERTLQHPLATERGGTLRGYFATCVPATGSLRISPRDKLSNALQHDSVAAGFPVCLWLALKTYS